MNASDPLSLATLGLRFGAATDIGLRRTTNEDAYLAASPIFMVADGMGGHDAGELASAIAVDAFTPLLGRSSISISDVGLALERARTAITALGHAGPRSAGTTVAGVAIAENDDSAYWLVFNLGDSRTYRLNAGTLEQISVDHSVVQELVDEGELNRASAAVHPDRNVITRALGAGGAYRPDYWLVPVEPGDRILICSDGVSGELDDQTVARILREETETASAAARLVHEGRLHGGRDNLTAVVVDAFDTIQDARVPAQSNDTAALSGDHGEDTIPRDATRAGRG
jgi:serine/threonine protein phosphatase PrpC